jgi:hypothetical protein
MDSQSPPKGSLEELFRHHLLESEAAAVPPRPRVWEHIDNNLLLAENEKYRRRLLVHRWGMAASLLLAALAGGGWWHSQQPASPNLARATTSSEAAQVAVAARAARPAQPKADLATQPVASQPGASAAWLASTSGAGAQQNGVASSGQRAAASSIRSRPFLSTIGQAATLGHSVASSHASPTYQATEASRSGAGAASTLAITSFSASTTQPIGSTTTSLSEFSSAATLGRPENTLPTASASEAAAKATTASAVSRLEEALLASKQSQLAFGAAAGLPALTPIEDKFLPAAELRRWRFGAEYAAVAFNPNIDFAAGTGYSPPAFSSYNPGSSSPNSPSNYFSVTSRSAAAEYRTNLRGGLGQRLSLRATRWLGGHWSLSTGLEAAQQHASSATSLGFDGVSLDMSTAYSSAPRQLQASSYRYRSAGVPVELRYDNPIKPGVSFYGRVGAIVSALLSVRTEIAGNPETARTYSPFSGSTPYRRLTTLLRGGAGVRYRPAHKGWGVSVGPTAEAGVQSLNSDTDKSLLQQNRPYSFGLEAGFEFNTGTVPAR